jgi:hypothetical protein
MAEQYTHFKDKAQDQQMLTNHLMQYKQSLLIQGQNNLKDLTQDYSTQYSAE